MKRLGVSILLAVSLVVIALPPFSAHASLPGIEDYTNERIVPLLISPTSAGADGSGFLYSSRIVFTSAHTAVTFDSNGKMIDFREELSVGKPNSNVTGVLQVSGRAVYGIAVGSLSKTRDGIKTTQEVWYTRCKSLLLF